MDLRSLFGRNAALDRRLAECRPALYRLAFVWCHDAGLADDLTQEALTKAVARIGQLRDPASLRPWLYGILANCWRDHLRALRPTEDIDSIEEHLVCPRPSPEQAAGQAELLQRVRVAIGTLPVGQRTVLSLVDLEDCSYAETAAILALPIGTVMSRLHRARAALRGVLAAESPAPVVAGLRRVK